MRSTFADEYNHDNSAATYDRSVADESNPIRAGYSKALTWIGDSVAQCSFVLDLGTGTGNTIAVLPRNTQVIAIDISHRMLEIAKKKLAGRRVEFIESDLLEYLENPSHCSFDGIVSSYTIHHLTENEKSWLVGKVISMLKPGGRAAIVDLMYRDASHRADLIKKYKETDPDTAESIEEEFFWDIGKAQQLLNQMEIGYIIERFSDLSWGILLTTNR